MATSAASFVSSRVSQKDMKALFMEFREYRSRVLFLSTDDTRRTAVDWLVDAVEQERSALVEDICGRRSAATVRAFKEAVEKEVGHSEKAKKQLGMAVEFDFIHEALLSLLQPTLDIAWPDRRALIERILKFYVELVTLYAVVSKQKPYMPTLMMIQVPPFSVGAPPAVSYPMLQLATLVQQSVLTRSAVGGGGAAAAASDTSVSASDGVRHDALVNLLLQYGYGPSDAYLRSGVLFAAIEAGDKYALETLLLAVPNQPLLAAASPTSAVDVDSGKAALEEHVHRTLSMVGWTVVQETKCNFSYLLDVQNERGDNLFHAAVRLGRYDIIVSLKQILADKKQYAVLEALLTQENADGLTPLGLTIDLVSVAARDRLLAPVVSTPVAAGAAAIVGGAGVVAVGEGVASESKASGAPFVDDSRGFDAVNAVITAVLNTPFKPRILNVGQEQYTAAAYALKRQAPEEWVLALVEKGGLPMCLRDEGERHYYPFRVDLSKYPKKTALLLGLAAVIVYFLEEHANRSTSKREAELTARYRHMRPILQAVGLITGGDADVMDGVETAFVPFKGEKRRFFGGTEGANGDYKKLCAQLQTVASRDVVRSASLRGLLCFIAWAKSAVNSTEITKANRHLALLADVVNSLEAGSFQAAAGTRLELAARGGSSTFSDSETEEAEASAGGGRRSRSAPVGDGGDKVDGSDRAAVETRGRGSLVGPGPAAAVFSPLGGARAFTAPQLPDSVLTAADDAIGPTPQRPRSPSQTGVGSVPAVAGGGGAAALPDSGVLSGSNAASSVPGTPARPAEVDTPPVGAVVPPRRLAASALGMVAAMPLPAAVPPQPVVEASSASVAGGGGGAGSLPNSGASSDADGSEAAASPPPLPAMAELVGMAAAGARRRLAAAEDSGVAATTTDGAAALASVTRGAGIFDGAAAGGTRTPSPAARDAAALLSGGGAAAGLETVRAASTSPKQVK